MNKMISQKDVASARKLSNRLKLIMLSLFSISTIFVVATHSLWLKYLISNPNEYVIPLILYIGYSCYSNSSMGTHNLFMALGYVKYNIPILLVVNAAKNNLHSVKLAKEHLENTEHMTYSIMDIFDYLKEQKNLAII